MIIMMIRSEKYIRNYVYLQCRNLWEKLKFNLNKFNGIVYIIIRFYILRKKIKDESHLFAFISKEIDSGKQTILLPAA